MPERVEKPLDSELLVIELLDCELLVAVLLGSEAIVAVLLGGIPLSISSPVAALLVSVLLIKELVEVRKRARNI